MIVWYEGLGCVGHRQARRSRRPGVRCTGSLTDRRSHRTQGLACRTVSCHARRGNGGEPLAAKKGLLGGGQNGVVDFVGSLTTTSQIL